MGAGTGRATGQNQLDQRFIAGLPDKDVTPLWEIPAKLRGRFQGSEGMIRVGRDGIVYVTKKPEESRTWRFTDIENIASAGPFDFSVVTREHQGAWNAGWREFRFQLKGPLTGERYNALWRRLNASRQSAFIQSSAQPAEPNH